MTALIGREQEFEAVKGYISKWLNEGEATCLFVNGVPGTGKTATVNEIVKSFKVVKTPQPKKRGVKRGTDSLKTDSPFKYIYVNCHGLTKQLDFCTAIYTALKNDKPKRFTALTATNEIEKILMETKCLMVLDEMDSLRAMGSALFSRVFTWPEKSDGNVFIIGISNLLNIADSCLPRRYAGRKPSTVTFKAYSSQQITSILMERLKSKMEESETKAIELCAKKVASMTGDIRRAFDLADRMINMRPTNEEPQVGLSTPRKRQHQNDENVPPATPKTPRTPASACRDALKLISQVEASPIVRAKLPFQPKFILACILRLLSMGRGIGKAQTLTDQQVFDICERVSKKLKFESCPPEGIKEALDILCMQGMIKVGKDRKIRVTVQVTFALSTIADNGNHLKMRPLTDDETEKLFEKLAKYIGENIKLLLENDDRVYCFRLHRDRVYYADEQLMRTAAIVARKDLVSFGTCLGKFTKGGKFFLHITALEYLAPYAKAKVWLKPAAEQQFLYGNNILKSGVARLTEGSEARQGAIVYSVDDKPLGFGVLSKGAAECRHADPTTIVILHQADLGEYIRNEEGLT